VRGAPVGGRPATFHLAGAIAVAVGRGARGLVVRHAPRPRGPVAHQSVAATLSACVASAATSLPFACRVRCDESARLKRAGGGDRFPTNVQHRFDACREPSSAAHLSASSRMVPQVASEMREQKEHKEPAKEPPGPHRRGQSLATDLFSAPQPAVSLPPAASATLRRALRAFCV
jgi:hypothetical protein